MKKSIRILEAFNDIDDKLLLEEYENEKLNKSNESWIKNINIKYVLTPALTFIMILACVIAVNNSNIKDNLEIAKKNEIEQINDNIVFNEYNIPQDLGDIDGKSVKMDVVSDFEFLNNLNVPDEYSLINQFALYEKENTDDREYTKLWQYSVLYQINGSNINDIPSIIEITFTKEDYILGCMLPDKETFPISIINGKEVYLSRSDKGKNIQAYFEKGEYKFFIDSTKLNESEFIDLIKSIID